MGLSKLTAAALASGAARGNFGAGAVLQVVSGSTSSSVTNNSSTWASTGLSVPITPSSVNSKILLLVNLPFQNGSNNYVYNEFQLMRNGAQVYYTKSGNSVNAYVVQLHVFHFSYLDSPNTTSALTFTLNFRTSSSAGEYGGEIFNPGASANAPQIIAMEIAG